MYSPSIKLPAPWSDFIPGPVEKIEHGWGAPQIFIKRLDLIRSWASGNKYYKLKHNMAEAIRHGVNTIVSKGGMFSNHLESLSEACMHFNIQCVCVIRTYSPDENNPSVRTLRSRNAEIIFLSPEKYNSYGEGDAHDLYPGSLFIPEGGSNEAGIRGTSEICSEIDLTEYSHLVVSGGTMSTAAGIGGSVAAA